MPLISGLFLFVLTIAFMEGFAYVVHRWVMHGRLGWLLHASHHRARSGMFELNDLYGVIFAVPSIFLLYVGVQGDWGAWAAWVGAGIAAYGAIYFGFHDVIVHRRIDHRLSRARPISSASSRRTESTTSSKAARGRSASALFTRPPSSS